MMRSLTLPCAAVLGMAVAAGCAPPERRPSEASPGPVDDEPVAGAPAESRPLRQGFTQRPAPDTPGLPAPIPPFLSEAERERARTLGANLSEAEAASAQREVDSLVETFEREPSPEAVEALRERVFELAKQGLIPYVPIEELYADYLFPSSEAEANARYRGKFAVFTGTVAPHNMKDFADGFKLVEQNPYVHDPLLLATDYELSFVECRLAHPSFQPLRDWQPIHLLAEVQGKKAADVLLRRCIVL